ncbi:MAG: stage III sporulation protein AE [Clostridia bacterium]|nr:stage III sporulation protein AE [Clostridia bacterium]
MLKVKFTILLVSLPLLLTLIYQPINLVYAQDSTQEEFETQIQDTINDFDYSILDKILETLSDDSKNIFGDTDFASKIKSLIDGDFKDDSANFINACLGLIFEDILEFLPILCIIVAIAILCGFIGQLQTSIGGKSLNDIIHFVCYGIIIAIVSTLVVEVVSLTTETLLSIKSQMEVIFPILLTLIASVGGSVSVSVFQPSIVLLSSGIMEIFNNIIVPIFIITIVFIIAQNISKNVQFSKFTSFFQSGFKWIIGSIFTVFFAFLTLNGIVANTYDSISIRTAKFTMKSYVPFVGGYLSDGFDLILSSSVLIKNAIGATGLILLLATIAMPIIKIVILLFGFKLTSAILEPITDSRISSFIFSVGKALNMLVACLLGVAFMYLLTVGILMCTCNLF